MAWVLHRHQRVSRLFSAVSKSVTCHPTLLKLSTPNFTLCKRTMFWFELLNFGEGSVDRDLSCGRYIGHISVNMDVYIDKISLSYAGTIDIKRHGTTILTAHSEDGGYSFPRTEKLLANESYGIYLKSSETVPFLLTWPPQDQDAYEAHVVGESFLAEESIGFAMDD